MKSIFATAIVLVLAVVSYPTNAWGADAASDAAEVKLQAAQIPNLQQAAASAGGYNSSNIKAKSTAHQVTVEVVDSKLNTAPAAERDAEASKIASAIAKAIAGKSGFAAVVTIHVDYVAGPGTAAKVVQGFVFNKGADGTFKPHQS
jgi:hypothetical protein